MPGQIRTLWRERRIWRIRHHLQVTSPPVLLLVLAAIACYSISLAPLAWVIISEFFPNRIRSAAMAVAVMALWLACFILTYTFPILNASLGASGTFWLYGVICLLGSRFRLHETPENPVGACSRKSNDI